MEVGSRDDITFGKYVKGGAKYIIDYSVGWGDESGVGTEVYRYVDVEVNMSKAESNLWDHF